MSISRVIQTSISALLIILFTLYISQVVVAYEDNTNKYIIFIIDRQALIDNEVEGSDLLQSLIGMKSIKVEAFPYLIGVETLKELDWFKLIAIPTRKNTKVIPIIIHFPFQSDSIIPIKSISSSLLSFLLSIKQTL